MWKKRDLLTREEFLNMVAMAESTPGPVSINSATYIGYKRAGVLGAAVATLAVCLPSFVLLYLISLFFDRFLAYAVVAKAFRGIQCCVVYLILSAGWKMAPGIGKTASGTGNLPCGPVCDDGDDGAVRFLFLDLLYPHQRCGGYRGYRYTKKE